MSNVFAGRKKAKTVMPQIKVMAVPAKVLDQIVAQVPMGRLGGTHEVAHLVSFLASEETSFITGANYSINGGQHVY